MQNRSLSRELSLISLGLINDSKSDYELEAINIDHILECALESLINHCRQELALCEDNFAYFISKNNTDDKCSKESYELPVENMTLSKQEFLNFYNYFPAIIKNAIIITTK